jgi:hypothetical protein
MRPRWFSPAIGPIYDALEAQQAGRMVPSNYLRTLERHRVRLPSDTDINEAAPITLSAGAVGAVVVSVAPGPTYLAWITGVAMGVPVLADFDVILWQVRVDRTPLPGFDSIRGPFSTFLAPRPIWIPLFPDQRLEIVATNLKGQDIPNVTAAIIGHQFPADPDLEETP